MRQNHYANSRVPWRTGERRAPTSMEFTQAIKLGQEAVAEQCRAIDGWREEVGKAKQQPASPSTAALEAQIEGMCRERMERAYKEISGATIHCTSECLLAMACLIYKLVRTEALVPAGTISLRYFAGRPNAHASLHAICERSIASDFCCHVL